MKKFLLCMMLAGLMMPVVAQEKMASKMSVSHIRNGMDLGISEQEMLPMNPMGTLVDVEGWKYAGTSNGYDRQTQGSVYPMTQIHDDGRFIGATWTNEDNPPYDNATASFKRRGVAYTFSTDGGMTWEEPDMRVGGFPMYWPSYAQWGYNGEAILARAGENYNLGDMQILNGLVLLTRKNKGVGEWNLAVVPYPEGRSPEDSDVLAWARMTTSGDHHQYIHIMTPMGTADDKQPNYPNPYKGYDTPSLYYRTQDGGETWDFEAQLVPEMLGEEWHPYTSYSDGINFAVQGNTVACSFIHFGSLENYVLKSLDNGDTWTSIPFYQSTVGYYGSTDISIDTVYSPARGCIALDLNGKMHLAFSVVEATNNGDDGWITYFSGFYTSFLSYWNEDMPPLDGNDVFLRENLEDLLIEDYFDWDLSEEGKYYVKSTVPQWPLVGFYTPTEDEHYFTVDPNIIREWMAASYGIAGVFSFPQMVFDLDNKMHLVYLGALDNGDQDGRWLRHPYYLTRDEDGNWSEAEYLVNTIDLIDREFAYPVCAGIGNNRMYMMAQVDPYAGIHTAHSNQDPDHTLSMNYFYFFNISPVPSAIDEAPYTPLTMQVMPNPASGQAIVTFEGKGNITVYNMLGQAVYHVENVENTKTISLNNMTTGVYFVTVRSGNATATQKLIVQ